jgi:hypothetical protein
MGGGSTSGGAPSGGGGSAARPVGFFGVTAGAPLLASNALLDRETPLMPRAGVTSLRVPFYWSAIEPHRGRFDFAKPDAIMTAAARAHLDVLPLLVGTPGWAAADPGKGTASTPKGTASYAAFAAAVVRRYGAGGAFWRRRPSLPADPVRAWQIWNEPNHVYYWSRQPFAARYVRLARTTRAAIKRADPKALVVSAGFADRSWDLLAQVERAGGRGVFDVVAVHPYTFEPRNVLRIVRLDRAALRHAHDDVPLWATEVTWSSGKGKVRRPLGFETTEAGQAARLRAVMPLLAANRRALELQRVYWESWLTGDANAGNTFDYSGLRRATLAGTVTPKPAFSAFRAFALHCRAQGC